MATGILSALHENGIRLQLRNGTLSVTGPKGVLTPDVLDVLREHKGDLLILVQEQEADHQAAVTRQIIKAGAVPIAPLLGGPWNHLLLCGSCGPVPWGAAGVVPCCPWCFIREAGLPMPRLVISNDMEAAA